LQNNSDLLHQVQADITVTDDIHYDETGVQISSADPMTHVNALLRFVATAVPEFTGGVAYSQLHASNSKKVVQKFNISWKKAVNKTRAKSTLVQILWLCGSIFTILIFHMPIPTQIYPNFDLIWM
jgi:hypothetical protein